MRTPLLLLALLLFFATAACGSDDDNGQPDAGGAAPETDVSDVTAGDLTEYPVVTPTTWASEPNLLPAAVHMTWQRSPATTVTLSWTTLATDLESYVPKAWVVPSDEVAHTDGEALMPWAEAFVTTGTGQQYQETFLGTPISEEVYVSWTVEVTGLQPDTAYTYRVGTWSDFDRETGVMSDPQLSDPASFKTGLPKGPASRPFSVMLAGDSRGGVDEIRANMPVISAMEADFWIFNGDMNDTGAQGQWDGWFDAMSPVLTSRVMMPVQGNHEIYAGVYYAQFALPQMPGLSPEMLEHAWSFDYANVHFVGLDSNTEAAVEQQVSWLETDLAAARADEKIDWIIAMCHHATYSASNHGSISYLIENFAPLFDEYDVDLVFNGHDHDYERTHPIRGGEVVGPEEGVVYVTAGAFFSPPYSNGNEWWTAVSVHGDKRNWVHMTVDGKRIDFTAYSGDGKEILDQYSLQR